MEIALQGAAVVCYTINLGQNGEDGIYLKNLEWGEEGERFKLLWIYGTTASISPLRDF